MNTHKITFRGSFLLFLGAFLLAAAYQSIRAYSKESKHTPELYLLVGTSTIESNSKGIYLYRFNEETGETDSVSMVEADEPGYLAFSPDERFVYSVGRNRAGASVAYAFAFDKPAGKLTLLNEEPTGSDNPCYITVAPTGRSVQTANYGGGSISSFPVAPDGRLQKSNQLIRFKGTGPDPNRQEQAHLHSVRYSPDGKFLFGSDLGTDFLYRMNVAGKTSPSQMALIENSLRKIATPSGTGPRHFDFHPNGAYFYLLGELSGNVIVYDYHQGDLKMKQSIAADTVGAQGSADIHVSPDGRFLYASNRLKADGIAIFSINPKDGTLTKVGYQLCGKHPRNFVIAPNGKFLLVASRDEDRIQVFRIDPETGLLTDIHRDIPRGKPMCLKFL